MLEQLQEERLLEEPGQQLGLYHLQEQELLQEGKLL